jgi:type I restriction enzyme S subunit
MMHAEIGSVSSAYHVYRVDSKIVFSEFIESYIRSRPEYYFGILGASSREGQSLSKTNFAITCMLMPSPDSVSKYERLFRQFEESRKNICVESQTLAKLRDVLLPKLISGELRIPQAEKMVKEAVA